MEYIGCKDAAFEVIDEASEKFGDLYFINDEKREKLNEICSLVDEIVQMFDDEFGCDAVTVDVDATTKELIFNIVCDEIILQHGRTHKFFELAQLVDSIRFSKAKPDSLRVEIGVSGLWIRCSSPSGHSGRVCEPAHARTAGASVRNCAGQCSGRPLHNQQRVSERPPSLCD